MPQPNQLRAETPAPDPLADLARRSRRLAQVVESSSRRRDCRDFRARLLLLLLEHACPLRSTPRRSWYVPGAAARVGPEGLRRAWLDRFGETPRSLRSFRAHLGMLESALALVRSPGDWMPHLYDPSHPERRPRYAETIHLLEDEDAALWWEGEGDRLRHERPEVRYNPTAWREVFEDWRARASRGDLDLVQIAERAPADSAAGPLSLGSVLDTFRAEAGQRTDEPLRGREHAHAAAAAIAGSITRGEPGWVLLRILDACGAETQGGSRRRLSSNPGRLGGAAALLAVALLRDDGSTRRRIRNRAGWLVRAFETASLDELRLALARVLREGGE